MRGAADVHRRQGRFGAVNPSPENAESAAAGGCVAPAWDDGKVKRGSGYLKFVCPGSSSQEVGWGAFIQGSSTSENSIVL